MEKDKKPRKLNAKKLVSYVGTLLMIVSLGFIAQRLVADEALERSLLDLLTSPWVIAGLLGIAALEGSGILLAGLNFRALVRNVSGILVKKPLALAVYTESNVYKYIPGGVMYVAGRNRLAVEVDDLSHGKVALATVLEGVGMVIGVVVVAVVFAFNHSVTYIMQMDILPIIIMIVVAVLLIAAPIVYFLRHKIGGGIKHLTSNMETINLMVIAKRLSFPIVLMFFYSLTFLMTLMLLGQEVTFELGFAIIGLYLLAWLAGFITPGAPSGLGVREVVMMMFLGDFVSVTILTAAMVIHRLLTVAGDIGAYVFAKVLVKATKSKEESVDIGDSGGV
jgi:hypothetical protein